MTIQTSSKLNVVNVSQDSPNVTLKIIKLGRQLHFIFRLKVCLHPPQSRDTTHGIDSLMEILMFLL